MHFVTRSQARSRLEGRSVCIVGGGPSAAQNEPGLVDSHDVVCRVNNYRLVGGAGKRCDVFFSFFGTSIRKTADELRRDGVTLCWAKCPNDIPIDSEWHRSKGKLEGIDFRRIYARRADWWWCDTFIPESKTFVEQFEMLGRRIPTTGFSAILEVLSCDPKSVYLTGFDFFASKMHEVDRPWRAKNMDDPIRHAPERERKWLIANINRHPITVDAAMMDDLRRA